MDDPLAPFLRGRGSLVLDGGLATELERAGFDLDHPLWSARLLSERPEAIAAVHRAYLEAGADCITTASYQATIAGFARMGATTAEAEGLLRRSVELALEARDSFRHGRDRQRPLVAASIGPYGAFLANGSEYTGAYDLDLEELVAFHSPRMAVLLEARPDLLACETIPSAVEARALARLLSGRHHARAWVSFSCRDGSRLWDGSSFADSVATVATVPQVVAIGVNCTAPSHVQDLLRAAAAVTEKPLVAYPNSGETYDAATRTWRGLSDALDWGDRALAWRDAGARLIGGCCRTGPDHVSAVRRSLG
ncbi:MAG TPA: homocysteine S-methyltransferase [Vicinamibacteria bacterium]|nr:homocysteine S-methyltransferase [Vicinamibacteria bacterium]